MSQAKPPRRKPLGRPQTPQQLQLHLDHQAKVKRQRRETRAERRAATARRGAA